MLAKLLALLLQSKAAAISAVLVVGTTGALVSASTENGVTTITVTQATQSSSVSPNNETNEVATDKDTEKDSDNDNSHRNPKLVTVCGYNFYVRLRSGANHWLARYWSGFQ